MRHILLDSSPLALASTPARSADALAMTNWMMSCLAVGNKIYIPEVIDYELRRELLRAGKINSVKKLDGLKVILRFLPISSPTMLLAANLWATSRQNGLPTGDPKKLDIDVILAAQALTLGVPTNELIIATSNIGHLSRFTTADIWSNIKP
jgi:predicted nucleic acid-binding protein